MDLLQFTSAVIGHLAWPTVIIVLFVILRKHMGTLADRLLEFSFGGAKITFDKILEKGAELIEKAPLPELAKPDKEPQLQLEPPASPELKEGPRRQLLGRFKREEFLNRSALVQIISGLEEVDRILYEIGDRLGIDAASPISVMHSLAAKEIVGKETAHLYDTLRDARNLIAHTNALPDDSEAIEYVRQASYLRGMLELVKGEIEKDVPPK
jgi:uncharacterized protein YutE (UPF0331/DUF86 family)